MSRKASWRKGLRQQKTKIMRQEIEKCSQETGMACKKHGGFSGHFQQYKWLDFARMEGIIFSVKEGNTVKVRRD